MSTSRRIQQEPAWILHHRPFRDSSRIIDILSRDHGRLSVVARGSRSAKSKLRGILRPFMPLQVSWVIRSDLGTMTGAEMNGAPISLLGDALLSGYYLNELLLNLMHRHDPQPEIFEAYRHAINELATNGNVAITLRCFEMALLQMLGYAPNLHHDTREQLPLKDEVSYEYRVEQGPVPVQRRDGPMVFSGRQLLRIGQQQFEDAEILRGAGRLLREVIRFHLGGKELKSRRVLMELRRPDSTVAGEAGQ